MSLYPNPNPSSLLLLPIRSNLSSLKMATSTPADVFPSGVKPFTERVFPKTICMFDVDGTLTPARKDATPDTMAKLAQLRGFTAVAFVGGSDLVKIQEQLGAGVGGHSGESSLNFDR